MWKWNFTYGKSLNLKYEKLSRQDERPLLFNNQAHKIHILAVDYADFGAFAARARKVVLRQISAKTAVFAFYDDFLGMDDEIRIFADGACAKDFIAVLQIMRFHAA